MLTPEGHKVDVYPLILGMQCFVLNSSKADMTALGLDGPQQIALAQKPHDHPLTSLPTTARSRRSLKHTVLRHKAKKPSSRVDLNSVPLQGLTCVPESVSS